MESLSKFYVASGLINIITLKNFIDNKVSKMDFDKIEQVSYCDQSKPIVFDISNVWQEPLKYKPENNGMTRKEIKLEHNFDYKLNLLETIEIITVPRQDNYFNFIESKSVEFSIEYCILDTIVLIDSRTWLFADYRYFKMFENAEGKTALACTNTHINKIYRIER